MRRLLALLPAAALVLAGCGADTCTSSPAQPINSNPSCTLAPGVSATIQVQLCAKCTDSAPDCQAEFRNGVLEVAPVVHQCQANLGCDVTGCNAAVPTATCQVTIPADVQPGSYQLVVLGETEINGSFNVSSGTSCTL